MDMNKLIDPKEKTLFYILAAISTLAWLWVIKTAVTSFVGPFIIVAFVALFFFVYLFAQSRMIAYFRGTGAVVTEDQFPDIHKLYDECCNKLEMKKRPTLILMHMDGMFNAFATRFLRKHFVILLSDVIDALDSEPDAIKFYMGHELGHIKRNHLAWATYLVPASWLPLVGSGYSRTCEYSCDRHGRACCDKEESAVKAMSALAVGAKRWKTMNVPTYLRQKDATKGFWMSFHEITSTYPWLVKRIAKLHESAEASSVPRRNAFAWILGAFVPKFSIVSLVVVYLIIALSVGNVMHSMRSATLPSMTGSSFDFDGYETDGAGIDNGAASTIEDSPEAADGDLTIDIDIYDDGQE